VKKPEEVMEILEAYDLTGSFRQAAALVGCDHKTVAYWVRLRDEAGGMPVVERARPAMEAVFAAKIDELVDRSHGKIRADKAHGKLVALGYQGSARTTRRWVAESKRRWRQKHGRRTRPWIPEPGLWLQWDYGDGPIVQGRATVLFCAWLAWSRFRVVVPLRDKTLPSVVMALDRSLRVFGGCPTYALTDNEKTVTVEHVCGIAVRNPTIVAVSRHYGLTIATCEPADPQSKGGSEATVRVAKADLVPTDHNLRERYEDFGALERACEEFMADVNTRPHRATMEPPVIRLAEEDEPELRPSAALAHHKCSYGPLQPTLLYARNEADPPGFDLVGECEYTVVDLFTEATPPAPAMGAKRQMARELTVRFLSGLERTGEDLASDVMAAGISRTTFERARAELADEGLIEQFWRGCQFFRVS
jgi:transposase